MNTVCKENSCTGCMACLDVCPKSAITIKDLLNTYNAQINEELCIKCGQCYKVCQCINPVSKTNSIKWYQGWAADNDIRMSSSSGGVARALSETMIKNGGLVCSCIFEKGEFRFYIAKTLDGCEKFKGSKYVKSNPRGIYNKIQNYLKKGEKVLFIGLPCQAAALKNYLGNNYEQNLYIVDLICHGTPSPKLLDIFMRQHGYVLKDLKNIMFREKSDFKIKNKNNDNKYIGIAKNNIRDTYMIAFLKGLCYTENCYHCTYANKDRVSDVTIGDSWGSKLNIEEQKRGISLILCQTQKGVDLINQCDLHLEDVDIEKAIAANNQLKKPSLKNKKTEWFFERIKNGGNFDNLVNKIYPFEHMKQIIKWIMRKICVYKHVCKYE